MIRPATAADAPALHDLLCGLAAHDGTRTPGGIASLLEHGFGPTPLFRALVAEDAGTGQGMVLYYPCYSTLRGKPGLHIEDLFVRPAARGQGLGRALVVAAVQQADWQPVFVTLGVDPENHSAHRFYASLGFKRRGYDLLLLDGPALTDPALKALE